jgi:hypothetical protein
MLIPSSLNSAEEPSSGATVWALRHHDRGR